MNKHVAIGFISCLGAAVAIAAPDSHLEQRLKELSRSPVDYAVAGKWFKIADEIENDGQRQEALMAAGAALIHAKRGDIYQTRIRQMLDDAPAFEGEFMVECPDCKGSNELKRPCITCKGTGRCQYANCQGGMHRVHQITGDKIEKCRECKGSGKCQKCNGEGYLRGKCTRCGGKGKSINMDKILASYKKHSETAARWEQVERERKEKERLEAEEKARIEAERMAKERLEAEEKARIEAERVAKEREREERRREREELAEEMRERGLVDVRGKWMTPGSVRNVVYGIFQIYEPGHALCRDKYGTVFCLLYSAEDNRNIAEGDVLRNDLYRCGTFSYITVQNAPSTVKQFAIDLEVASREIKKQNGETDTFNVLEL